MARTVRPRPLPFLRTYVARHPWGHALILGAVVGAVICSVSTQYGLKHLIDCVAAGPQAHPPVWSAFLLLCGFIAADNLLWRVGGWTAARTFVAVTGNIRQRPVCASERPFAELVCRASARRAGRPDLRHR